MRVPAKLYFSERYSSYDICGALGSWDQGFTGELDIAARLEERVSVDGGSSEVGGEVLGAWWRSRGDGRRL